MSRPATPPRPSCGECGYVLAGSQVPDECPGCGARLTATRQQLRESELEDRARRAPTRPAGIVLLMLALILTTTTTAAQGPRPWERPTWQVGASDRGVGVSWWWRYQQNGSHPVVTTVPPGLGWGLCPGPANTAQMCIVSVQGPWVRVVADGALLAERGRVYLPAVRR